jgi:cadmium resistance protein CadD (predicted permease)
MGAIFVTAATAAGLFAGTNIDDIIVLAVLNASSRADGRPAAWQIWAGQYAGIGVLVAVSLLAALGLKLVSESWLWILGVIPLGLGLFRLFHAIRAQRAGRRASPAVAAGLTGVIGVTLANGGDNVAAYTPVFRTLGGSGIAVTIVVFAIGVALWCLAGFWLVSHHGVTGVIERWGHWIVPAVFILIGLYIFHKGGVL